MEKLFARQIAQAKGETGEIDINVLAELVIGAYTDADRDRRRADRSMALMIDELDEAHQWLLEAFEAIPEGIAILDARDRFVRWNKQYAEMYAPGEQAITVGKEFTEVLRAGICNGLYPDAAGRENEFITERLTQHRQETCAYEQHLKNNRWVRVEQRRTSSGRSVIVTVDITDLKKREESFRLLFDSNPMPMWVLDVETQKFLAINRAAIKHYGYSREQFLAMTTFDIRPTVDREDFANHIRSGNSSGGKRIWRHQKSDGSCIFVSIYARPMNYQGRACRLNAIVDVTEKRLVDEELVAQKFQTETAISNMSQGLVLFDAFNRISVCNRQYIEMYGLSAEVVKPGCSLIDLMTHRQQLGLFTGDVNQVCLNLYANIAKGDGAETLCRLEDGRSIQIVNRPIAAGGWVETHENVTERERASKKIAYLARYDSLTDLPNRATFREQLEQSLKKNRRSGSLAILYLDIDEFKRVNDHLGHSVGDELLRAIGARLRSCVGESDTVARLGGDEFAIIQHVTRHADIVKLAEKIHKAIRLPFDLNGHQLVTETSIGIALAPQDSADADRLLKAADVAMYVAKASGRGTTQFFEAEMDARMQARQGLERDLREAIMCGDFEVHYQPQYNLQHYKVSGLEALIRWRHRKGGLISPVEFIPIAEETGLINEIGEWVLRKACVDAATWPDDLKVAVNISPVQFTSGNIVQLVMSALSESGLQAQRLELELTEAVLIRDDEKVIATLQKLRSLGVRIAMDDFGTGYSSLSYLRRFPFDKIKIDRSFIKDILEPDSSLAIVRAVVDIAKSRDIATTAEGVEIAPQMELLRKIGCTEVQGYLISPALPVAELLPLFKVRRDTVVAA